MPEFYTRNGTADAAIIASVFQGGDYSPDLIDYSSVRFVVDVGGHIGAYSCFIKTFAPDAQVIAIEPDIDNAIMFLMNTRDKSNVALMVARVAYQWLDVTQVHHTFNTGGVSFVPSYGPNTIELSEYQVELPGNLCAVVTLEQVIGNRQSADVLKVDCEGAEFDILINAPLDTLARFQWIVGEFHCPSGNIEDITKRLRGIFAVQRVEMRDDTVGVFCLKRYDHA